MDFIKIIILISIIYISVNVFILIMMNKKVSKFTFLKLEENLKKSKKGIQLYENLDKKLNKYGISYKYKWITPINYILLKLFVSILIFVLVLISINLEIAIISSIAVFLIFDFIIKASNNSDNEEIMIDLKNVYDTLRIQTKAGVYLTKALTECYLSVSNKRLKSALLDLNNKITRDNDVETVLNQFQAKFNNRYIDTFCIVIKQSIYSGKTVQILEDLSTQIKDIEEALNIKLLRKIKSKLSMYQVLIFIGMILMVLFVVFIQIQDSLRTMI